MNSDPEQLTKFRGDFFAKRQGFFRRRLKKFQPAFSKLLGVPMGTIRDWEQGRKQPDSAAITLIKVAQRNPEVLEAVAA